MCKGTGSRYNGCGVRRRVYSAGLSKNCRRLPLFRCRVHSLEGSVYTFPRAGSWCTALIEYALPYSSMSVRADLNGAPSWHQTSVVCRRYGPCRRRGCRSSCRGSNRLAAVLDCCRLACRRPHNRLGPLTFCVVVVMIFYTTGGAAPWFTRLRGNGRTAGMQLFGSGCWPGRRYAALSDALVVNKLVSDRGGLARRAIISSRCSHWMPPAGSTGRAGPPHRG